MAEKFLSGMVNHKSKSYRKKVTFDKKQNKKKTVLSCCKDNFISSRRFVLSKLPYQNRYCTISGAKTKALISCAVTAQLISAFVFTYADCWFSGAAFHFISSRRFVLRKLEYQSLLIALINYTNQAETHKSTLQMGSKLNVAFILMLDILSCSCDTEWTGLAGSLSGLH